VSEEPPEKEKWIRLRVKPPPVLQEVLSNFLIEQTDRGVQLEGEWITAFSRWGREAQQCFQGLYRYYQGLEQLHPGLPELEVIQEELEGVDWGETWKAFFKPFRLGKTIVVKPTWEPYQPKGGDVVIEIDPGRAFGTGRHPSTALCIEMLEGLLPDLLSNRVGSPPSVLDVGTGTGILGIVAAQLGASRVLGIDIDPDALEIATENLNLNRVSRIMAVNATPLDQLEETFELVMANLTAALLDHMAAELVNHVIVNGRLLVGGILVEQAEDVVHRFRSLGLELSEQRAMEDWRALLLREDR
jgi:ribosomal protein L11 methyltransferase